jgi:hypothetical protein
MKLSRLRSCLLLPLALLMNLIGWILEREKDKREE